MGVRKATSPAPRTPPVEAKSPMLPASPMEKPFHKPRAHKASGAPSTSSAHHSPCYQLMRISSAILDINLIKMLFMGHLYRSRTSL